MIDFQPEELPRRPELWEGVIEQLRTAIVRGDLPQGTRLVEAALSTKLKVSRGPIRDALMRLERERLVESLPTRGVVVAGVSETDVAEVYGLRLTLELMAARLILDQPAPPDLTTLERLVGAMARAEPRRQAQAFADADIEFHRELLRLAGHRRLAHAWEELAGTLKALLSITNAVYEDMADAVAEHRAIVSALAAGDRAAASTVIERQILNGQRVMLSTVRARLEPGPERRRKRRPSGAL